MTTVTTTLRWGLSDDGSDRLYAGNIKLGWVYHQAGIGWAFIYNSGERVAANVPREEARAALEAAAVRALGAPE